MTTPNHRRFSVCLLTSEGTLRVLFHSDCYDQCDEKLDYYSEIFPNAIVDIYKRDVLQNCVLAN